MCKKPLILPDRVVKCGQCIECLIQRSQEWSFRLEEEAKDAKSGVFLTLTYDPDEIPICEDENGNLHTTLYKKDVQNFLKKCRYYQGKHDGDWKNKVRYFAIGEYGDETKRAHYHMIIFNLSPKTINKLDKIWNKGFVKRDDVNPKTIRYVTNYMLLKDKDIIPCQQKPFAIMSKKPILGAGYVIRNYATHVDDIDPELKRAGKHKRPLFRSLSNQVFTPKQIPEFRKKRDEMLNPWIENIERIAKEKEPLDPHGYMREQVKQRAETKERMHKNKRKKI